MDKDRLHATESEIKGMLLLGATVWYEFDGSHRQQSIDFDSIAEAVQWLGDPPAWTNEAERMELRCHFIPPSVRLEPVKEFDSHKEREQWLDEHPSWQGSEFSHRFLIRSVPSKEGTDE